MSSPVWVYYTPGKSIEVCLKGADLDHADHGCQRAEYDEVAALVYRSSLAFGRVYRVEGRAVLALGSKPEFPLRKLVRQVDEISQGWASTGRFTTRTIEYDEQVEVQ